MLWELGERCGDTYTVAVRPWEKYWYGLATMFDHPTEILRPIYATNTSRATTGRYGR